MSGISHMTPAATDEEAAAIAAAIEVLWPRPALTRSEQPPSEVWRFSGRWWQRGLPAGVARPWQR